MDAPTLKPLVNRAYKVKQRLVIAEGSDLRVIDQTLAPGEAVPWHLHPDHDDYVICLRGEMEIREINPDKATRLRALDRYVVPKKRPHTTMNTSSEDCQFVIVQGPGRVEFVPLPKLDERK